MRALFGIALVIISLSFLAGCKSSTDSAKTFCDTVCMKDTVKFVGDHKLEPYIHIVPDNCAPSKIIRGYKGMGTSLTTDFGFTSANINKDYMRVLFGDTAFAYILFNDCLTGRGYQMKLPFNKTGTISKRQSGINNIDPKFAVANNMVAYTDRGNIFVEEVGTGKTAMMTFGKMMDIDYEAIHEYIDSVNVTSERIWVRVKIDEKWTELEKKITLE
jgi:hypothetical protein